MLSACASGCAGRRPPTPAASATILGQRSGERRTRRSRLRPLRLQVARDHAVRRDHEIFDELLRAVPFVGAQIRQHAVVEDRPRLHCLEVECAALVANASQRLRGLILLTKLAIEPGDC